MKTWKVVVTDDVQDDLDNFVYYLLVEKLSRQAAKAVLDDYDETIEELSKVEELSKIGNYIILSGTGGLGKSMMMRHFLLSAVADYYKTGILPLFVALKDFNDSYVDLAEYVFLKIKDLYDLMQMILMTRLLNFMPKIIIILKMKMTRIW